MIKLTIKDVLRNEIEKALKKLITAETSFKVSQGGIHADYSSTVVFRKMEGLARALSVPFGEVIQPKKEGYFQTPQENAEFLKKELLKSDEFNKYFSKVEIINGFLNFWLSEKGFSEGLVNISDSRYLPKWKKEKREKISLDYLDANPTGPVHLGHARSGFYGDVLANILEFYGHKVSREFYVNNAKSSKQIQSLGMTALGRGEEYRHEQLSKILKNPVVKKRLSKIQDEKEAGFLVAKYIQKENEKFLKKIAKIKFDLFFEEESVYAKGGVEEIVEKLKKLGAAYEKDGALWFKSSQYGDTEDRVVVRSTGEPTYFVPDIYYHLDRLEKRKNDFVINIFGADHYGTLARVKGALYALGVDTKKIIYLLVQMARLTRGGQEVKMSKRKGEFVTLEELTKEVGLDAARFFFLMRSLDTHLDFDLDLAKERSKKNPIYYVQYAHARACSILRKSEAEGKRKFSSTNFLFPERNSPTRNLILKLIQFPEIIEDVAKDYQVHRLTTYAYELAKVFTDFYENIRVLNAESEELKKIRLALVFATRKILGKTLSLMGISAPEKM